MKKKQKSHKVKRRRTASKKKSPWSYKSKPEAQPKSEFRIETEGMEPKFSDSDDMKQLLDDFKNNKEFFEYEKPIIEIHGKSKVETLSATKIMKSVNDYAGIIATDKSLQGQVVANFRERNFSKFELKIDDLDRIAVRPDDSGPWSIDYIFSEGTDREAVVPWLITTAKYDRDLVEHMIEWNVSVCMFIEGEIHPENSIQERTFLLDEAAVSINKKMFKNIKEYVKQRNNTQEKPEMPIELFQQFKAACGGKVTNAKLTKFDDDWIAALHLSVALALAHGFKKWPE